MGCEEKQVDKQWSPIASLVPQPIPATGVSNGMAGGADLILQGNTLLHTARRGSTPRRWCCPCARWVSGGGGTGGGGPLWVVCGCYWPPGGPLWVVCGCYWPQGGSLWVVLRHNIIIWPLNICLILAREVPTVTRNTAHNTTGICTRILVSGTRPRKMLDSLDFGAQALSDCRFE